MLLNLLVLIISITIHEFAHAYLADRLGDPTPRANGRLSLNPLKHLDMWGIFFMLMAGIGWAKPVPIDLFNLKNPKRDQLIIAFSGPLSNILLAIAFGLFVHLLPITSFLAFLGAVFVNVNISLAIFNLVPIYPLDGFHVVAGLLNEERRLEWLSLRRYGIFVLLLFLLPISNGNPPLFILIEPIIRLFVSLLLPGGII